MPDSHNSQRAAIVVAGGSGSRMLSELPKQFLPLRGRPLLMHTLEQFHKFDPAMKLVLALPPAEHDRWRGYCAEHRFTPPHSLVPGGATRFHSVRNALHTLPSHHLVAVHDGVRPFASPALIARCFQQAERTGSAVPVIQPFDTIRQLTDEGSKVVPRDAYRLVQTPQVFAGGLLRAAYSQADGADFTDDASVVEAQGHEVYLVEGERENIKITTPFDLIVAEALLQARAAEH